MATTKRQDKILATIERLRARKAKFESGAYNKKYEKMFGDDDRGFRKWARKTSIYA